VILSSQTACKRCARPMSSVAEIAPLGGGPGLIAFMCTDCGATDSVLTYAMSRSRQGVASAEGLASGRNAQPKPVVQHTSGNGPELT
jgi:hypothetical protein